MWNGLYSTIAVWRQWRIKFCYRHTLEPCDIFLLWDIEMHNIINTEPIVQLVNTEPVSQIRLCLLHLGWWFSPYWTLCQVLNDHGSLSIEINMSKLSVQYINFLYCGKSVTLNYLNYSITLHIQWVYGLYTFYLALKSFSTHSIKSIYVAQCNKSDL